MLDLIYAQVRAYQRVTNVPFSENLTCFFFLETPLLRFTLLLYYRRIQSMISRFLHLILLPIYVRFSDCLSIVVKTLFHWIDEANLLVSSPA